MEGREGGREGKEEVWKGKEKRGGQIADSITKQNN